MSFDKAKNNWHNPMHYKTIGVIQYLERRKNKTASVSNVKRNSCLGIAIDIESAQII